MRQTTRRAAFAALFATTSLIALPAFAQDAQDAEEENSDPNVIVVTAQKRSESLQNVPISIQALGTQKLDQLNVTDFKDYAAQLPSVSFQTGGGPGSNVIYMRGVASGGDGNHSGSLPSVGVYLDEQPVTTIGGNLDVHIYDIARIESLSGPQGTLYGASSEAGTIRIITNKPSTAGFEGRVDGEVNTIEHGGVGGKLEGMINAPLSDRAALRVVGFYERQAGYIDNVAGSRTFCGTPIFDSGEGGTIIGCNLDGISVNNAAYVKENYNYTDTWGARAALKVDLDDTWTATPTVLYQELRGHGTYAMDSSLGDLQVQRFAPEIRKDRFIQAALTLEGKLGNWDVTYAGAYLDRKTYSESDYTDYSESYDALYAAYVSESGQCSGLAGCFYYNDAAGNVIDPRQRVIGTDHFKKMSHELRVASPSTDRFRIVAGMFMQRQSNEIYQDYLINNLGPLVSVNGSPGTLWLTKQERVDRDYAMFGEMSFDVTDQFTLTAGGRAFIYDNSLIGFFGFGRNPGGDYSDYPRNGAASNRTGVIQCFTTTGQRLASNYGTPGVTLIPGVVDGTPCTNLGVYAGNGTVIPKHARGSGATYRFNATYKPNSDLLFYATFSRGFRPGGLNRRGDFPDYQPDYLKNYELGFKTTLAPGLRLNGAVYHQKWDAFQFSYLGPNSFTVITNGPTAKINGAELDMSYSGGGLSLNVAGSYTDAKLENNLCAEYDPTFQCNTGGNSLDAPAGTRLPVTPQWKLSGTARYTTPMGSADVYGQINAAYQSEASSDLRTAFAAQYGPLHEFALVNLAVGAEWEKFNFEVFVANLFDERGELSKYAQCGACTRTYIVPTQPRTFGVRAGAKF